MKLKLSEAILLGDSLKKPDSTIFLHPRGDCGCALGGAFLAIGAHGYLYHPTNSPEFMAAFPWFTCEISAQIGVRYHAVTVGQMTIEQLADYVRQIEPPEDDPPIDNSTGAEEVVCAKSM